MRRLAFVLLSAIAACTSPPPQPRPADGLPPTGAPVDLVRIHKAARTLEVWSRGRSVLILTRIQLGHRPIGPKQFEGDGRTPEGRYLIDWRNPRSSYHLSLHVSYPDPRQVAAARTQGRSAGGMIMIHGQPNGRATRMSGDWTDGCIALSNQEIEILWDLVPDGAIIEILA